MERLRLNIVKLRSAPALAVLGSVGHGKSSMVNSMCTAFAEELQIPAPSGDGTDSFTKDSHPCKINIPEELRGHGASATLPLCWDTPGGLFQVRYLSSLHS